MGNVPKLRFPQFSGEWELSNLLNVCSKIQDGNYGASYPKANEFISEGIPFLTSKAIQNGVLLKEKIDYISVEKHNELKKAHLQLDDVLFTNRGSNVGNICFVEKNIANGNIGPQLTLLRPNNKILSFFLYQTMNTFGFRKQVQSQDSGSAMNFFGIGATSKFKLNLPQKQEQEKIASFLSAMDKKIEKLEEKIALQEKYKKAMMQKLFSQEIRFKTDDGSDFPYWEEKRLKEIGKIITGSTPKTSNKEFYGGNNLFVSPFDIQGNRYIRNTKTTLTDLGFSKGRKIEKGSVCFVCIGSTIGKVAQIEKEVITNQQINSIVSNEENINEFVFSLLFYNSKKIKLLAGEHAIPQINKTDFSNLKFFFPSKQEQQKIANFLSSLDKKIEATKKQKQKAQEFKKGLLQQMFV